ncbi:hypothetical protein MMC17_007479 [Xylographa soralifera]|nr:hypothetical protein [Xylographa soralifera]
MLSSTLSLLLLALCFPLPILGVIGGGDFYSNLPIPRDRLFCNGPLPPGIYGDEHRSWEIWEGLERIACGEYSPWSAANFTDLSDLCTMRGNPEGNLGGICDFRVDSPFFRRPDFDIRFAAAVLLYDDTIMIYCRLHCFCPDTEDEYLANDLHVARQQLGISDVQLPDTSPTPLPPRRPLSPDVPVDVVPAVVRVPPATRLQAYRGRGFQCMGVQGRGTSGMMSCYCGVRSLGPQLRGGLSAPVRAVTFLLGG